MTRTSLNRASLLLNGVFAITVLILFLQKSKPAPTTSAYEPAPRENVRQETATDTSRAVPPSLSPRYGDNASASGRRRWLVEQLREAGVPNRILARVVLSDLEEHYDRRIEACDGDADSMALAQLEFDRNKDAEMRAALGEEGFKLWDRENMLREANSGKVPLTTAETDTLYGLKKKLQQRQWELEEARLKKEMDDADINDASEKAYAAFNQEMKELLGDQRYAKSQGLDDDVAAESLRHNVASANPTDAQFQELLKAQQQWNEQRSELDQQFQADESSPAYAAKIQSLDEARDREYQRVLGTNVFDALQKEQDGGYSKMKKYADLWGLDDRKMDYVYATMKYYEKSVQDYNARARALEAQGQSVDWEAMNKNLRQFVEQTRQALQDQLGQDRFDKLQRNGVFQFSSSPGRVPMQ